MAHLAQPLLSVAARSRRCRGFTLPELLVVVAIVGLCVVLAVPLVSHQVKMARVRGAARQFTSDLRAARMIAVSTRRPVDVRVVTDPDNYYEYADSRGGRHRIEMPEGVRIVSSTSPIVFGTDGSIPAEASTLLVAATSGGAEDRWTIVTSVLGIPKTTHERRS